MITVNEIKDVFKKEFPKRKIVQIIDFSDKYYVVCATSFAEDYNNPYFTLDKTNNEIGGFSITDNFDKFWDAVDNRTIYEAK